MNHATAVRLMGLYVPVVIAVALAAFRPRVRRLLPAALVGLVWTLPSLLAIQLLNLHFRWWQFHAQGGLFRGMPADLYLGWAVLWGAIPILAFQRINVAWVTGFFLGIDVLLMPLCRPIVELGSGWWAGEMIALCVVLVPAQLFARWTLNDVQLGKRAALHVLAASGLFLFLVPELVFALRPGHEWGALLSSPGWLRNFEFQAVAMMAVLGVSAVQEFAQRGGGTPIPYDPPKRLVVSGLYRFVANPMQLSCALVMTAWGAILRNSWVAGAGIMSFIYGVGLATWDEGEDMKTRFGRAWEQYRGNVPSWRFRLKPWHDPNRPAARLYIAETCAACSELRSWFESHEIVALEIVPAERHPTRELRRITYDPMDDSDIEEGVKAFARGLEHLHLGWAFVGACLRLPGISHFVQLLMDAGGFGPRAIATNVTVCRSAAHVRRSAPAEGEHAAG